MKKFIFNNSIYLYFLLVFILFNVFIQILPYDGTVYFWGRKIDLKPEFIFSLDYVPGSLFVYEFPKMSKDESEHDLSAFKNMVQSRVRNYYHYQPNLFLENKDDKNFLVVEASINSTKDDIDQLLTKPGRLNFYIQKNDVVEEDLILSDDWLTNFSLVEGVSEKNVVSAKAQIDFQSNQPVIAIVFDAQARQVLLKNTKDSKSKILMAMFDDSIVLMSPISEPILNGKIVVSGGRFLYQAEMNAAILLGEESSIIPLLPQEESNLDLSIYSERPRVSLFNRYQLYYWQFHLLIVICFLVLSSILLIIRYKKIGTAALLLILGIFFLNFSLIRLTGTIVSFPMLIAAIVIYLWLFLPTLIYLKELSYLKDRGSLFYDAIRKVFFLRRRLIRRPIATLFLAVLASYFITQLDSINSYSSLEFVKALQQFGMINIFIYFFIMFALTKHFSRRS